MTLRTLLSAHTGAEITADTVLAEVLDPVDRICSLPFWIEEATGHMVPDAELLSWVSVGDAERWMGVGA